MTVVTFNVDQYPYCKGDVVNLDKAQLKAVDDEADRRGVKAPYSKGEKQSDVSTDVAAAADENGVETPEVTAEKEEEQSENNAEAHEARVQREEERAKEAKSKK